MGVLDVSGDAVEWDIAPGMVDEGKHTFCTETMCNISNTWCESVVMNNSTIEKFPFYFWLSFSSIGQLDMRIPSVMAFVKAPCSGKHACANLSLTLVEETHVANSFTCRCRSYTHQHVGAINSTMFVNGEEICTSVRVNSQYVSDML